MALLEVPPPGEIGAIVDLHNRRFYGARVSHGRHFAELTAWSRCGHDSAGGIRIVALLME
jgi:hypothetical protein